MPTFTTATPLAGRVRTELAQRAETYAYLSTIVAQHRRKTFADPATAAATIAAMGRDAAAALAWDAATVAYLNVVGPSLGKPAVPPSRPGGVHDHPRGRRDRHHHVRQAGRGDG